MPTEQPGVVLIGPLRPVLAKGFADLAVHELGDAADRAASSAASAHIRAMAVSAPVQPVDDALFAAFPRLQIVASFGVGYDHINAKAAARRGIVVTHTPDVLTEEVADTAIGLLLNTVRELPQAERYLRAGKWPGGNFPLSRATLRDRIVGMVGLGRIGIAIARRLEAFGVQVVYHTRQPRPELGYRHYPRLIDMARYVDILIVIGPGGAATKNMIDAEILAAGLDVFAAEPQVPVELLAMENVVLLPHVGSASEFTRAKMDQLLVDNIRAWAAGKPPLTPVPETPFRSWK